MNHAQLVLVGAGHSHLVALDHWRQRHRPRANITLITPYSHSLYSGLLPGVVAGHFAIEGASIPVAPLCRQLGIRLVIDTVEDVDPHRQQVITANQHRYDYDVLSINCGGNQSPQPDLPHSHQQQLLRPLASWWQQWPQRLEELSVGRWQGVHILGAGAAGFELACGIRRQLLQAGQKQITVSISDKEQQLLPSLPAHCQQQAHRQLRRLGVEWHSQIDTATLSTETLILLCTPTEAPGWFQLSQLNCNHAGFLPINDHLLTEHANVFACGDCAELQDVPHSGVHAVKQGKVLARNLNQSVHQQPITHRYQPKAHSLQILSGGERWAMASWSRWSISGRWVWHWKRYLDQRFIRRFTTIRN